MKNLIKQERVLSIWLALFLGQSFAAFGAEVTFQINMGIQSSIGRFDAAGDFAEVRGSFDNWGAGLILDPSPEEAGVWEGSIEFFEAAGSVVQYKFVITQPDGTVVWEGFVGEGNQNRAFTLEESDQTLPVAFFDNVSVDPGAGIPVMFQVDMTGAANGLDGTVIGPVNEIYINGDFIPWWNWGSFPGEFAMFDDGVQSLGDQVASKS